MSQGASQASQVAGGGGGGGGGGGSQAGTEASGNGQRRALQEITFTPQNNTVSVRQNPLILDSNFLSGAFPSDNNKYKTQPSTLLPDGGMETLNVNGNPVKTYLYRIPDAIFEPILLPKFGGRASFYVTLDRALMQAGGADGDERHAVDVENAEWDPDGDKYKDMNVRIHVGEGVTSYPWPDISAFYQPRRFLGKVWYEQVLHTPCHLHETYPSASPSELVIPELPLIVDGDDDEGEEEEKEEENSTPPGEEIETRFVVTVFLQQDIEFSTRMNDEVMANFTKAVLKFLNEEYVYDYCIWGTELEVTHQKMSLLVDGRDRNRNLRGGGGEKPANNMSRSDLLFEKIPTSEERQQRRLQTEITILQVEVSVDAVAYDDPGVCPEGAIPATPTDHGDDWEESVAWIGIDYIIDNSDRLVEKLRSSHEYFDAIIVVSADPELLTQKDRPASIAEVGSVIEAGEAQDEEKEDSGVPLIPIVAAAAGAVVLCALAAFCFVRRRKKRKRALEEEEEPPTEELAEMPDDLGGKGDTDQEDSDKPTAEAAPVSACDMEEEECGVAAKETDSTTLPLAVEEDRDQLMEAWPKLRHVQSLEETIMTRGLPRRRSEPNMATISFQPNMMTRTRSIGCIREVWINLNKPSPHQRQDEGGEYLDELLLGTLYPIDDPDLLYLERERHIVGEDGAAPYVPHGAAIDTNFIDEDEVLRIESPREAEKERASQTSEEGSGDPSFVRHRKKANPLVMQQVEMLEAKWKELREEYDDEDEYSDDEVDMENFDVNGRIDQLMGHIEKLELERKMRLNELKRQEVEEEELARKRMVRAGTGINYNDEFNKDFVIRKKKKKKVVEDIDADELSDSSSEEEQEDGEFDVKWMRLKVPLAAQDPGTMKTMVKTGKGM